MMDFINASDKDLQAYGHNLLNSSREKFDSFEAVSNAIVTQLYKDFLTEDGNRLFELVRIFKMVDETELPPEGQQDVPQSPQWLSLVATVGSQPAWNNRLDSAGHRLLPANAFETPMLKATFEQIGLNNVNRDFVREVGFMANYFHVEKADGSPYIVVQDEFVKRYGIESVVGIGSPFKDGSMYVMLGFASSPITKANAQKFAKLSPFIGTLLAYYRATKNAIWMTTS